MFCHECGSELSDEVKFCPKCGAKVMYASKEQQIPLKGQNMSENKPFKKKSKKRLIVPIAAVMVTALIIIANIGGGTDYVATVGTHEPFEVRKLSYTYEDVLNTYISHPEWKTIHESDDVVYVDISGKIKGTDSDVTVAVKAVHDPQDSRLMLMTPESVNIDGISLTDSDAVEFLYAMFKAYDEKENDLSQLLELTKLLFTTEEMNFTETYTNESEGISFKYPYPIGWVSIDATGYNSEDNIGVAVAGLVNEKYSGVFYSVMAVEKYPGTPQQVDELFINDQAYAAKYLNNVSVIETSVVELDGIPARKTVYTDSDSYGHRYLYNVGNNVYRVELGCEKDYAERYEKVFDAIMDSYVITKVSLSNSEIADDIPYGYEGDAPGGSISEGNYTDYIEWGGSYDDGWMDTTLTFSLYSDGTQDPGCGYMTTYFRGMESSGKLYYLGGNEFQWESEGYDSLSAETYYVCAVYNNGAYQLELYNSEGEYEVTFTLYEQYIP